MDVIITEFLQAMYQQGIVPTSSIQVNGEIQRFHIKGDTANKANGWAVVHPGPFPSGVFGNWKTGVRHQWQFKTPTTQEERRAHKKAMRELYRTQDAERLNRYAEAAEKARSLIDASHPADPAHPYLLRKQIQPIGVYQQEQTLLIPMYDGIALASVQAIYADGFKQFLKGGKTKGCHLRLGEWSDQILICEGYATGATLRQSHNATTIIAFTANNLVTVAQAVRHERPAAVITIAADNDLWTEGNPGLTKARHAAVSIRGKVIYPDFSDLDTSSYPTDFNDYVRLGGVL
ncbi:toprim domain-containing protein [Gammaproteobacteria bacterium]|nr:toprim domain-containing protein [Gammaproteobacteria bacterium]